MPTADIVDDAATLRRQLDEATRRAESLRHVIESISGELALEPLLTRIVESAVTLIGARLGSIGLVVEQADGPVVRTAAIYNMPAHELGAEMRPGVGVAGAVLRTRQPIRLDRYGAVEQPTLPEFADHALIGVPIWWGDEMIGFFGIGAPPPIRFQDADVETLALFARHAAIAIVNARSFAIERQRASRVEMLNRIGRLIAGSLSLDELLRTTVEALDEHLRYRNIAILLADPDDPDALVLRARNGIYAEHVIGDYRQSIRGGIIGAAIAGGCPLLIPDVRADPRYIAIPDVPNIRSELAVPIVIGGQALGALNIESQLPLTDEDAAGLQIVADQLASAITNARLFEAERRRAARIEEINRIGRLIASSLSLEAIFQTAVAAIHEQLGFTYVGAGLVAPHDLEMLMLLSQAGAETPDIPPDYRQSIHVGIIGEAARTRKPVLVQSVADDPRYLPMLKAHAIRAELAVPIVLGEQLLGVLNIESEQPISADDAAGVEIIADQLGIAIDNARRYEEEQRRTARLELIAHIGQRLAAQLDPDELFATTVQELHNRLGYDHVSLFLVDPAAQDWLEHHAVASDWLDEHAIGYRQLITRGILGAAARQRTAELVNDVASDPRYVQFADEDDAVAELAMPILLGRRLLGVLDIASRQRFGAEDVTAVQVVADQLATAIENARLFAESQRALERTRLLYETSRRINAALSADDVVAAYLEHVAARGNYACGVMLYELGEAGQRIARVLRGHWTPRDGLAPSQGSLPYVYDPLVPLLDAGQTVMIADIRDDTRISADFRDYLTQSRWRALAMIPLIVHAQRLGLVWLAYSGVHTWSDTDLYPYQVTAALLAAAIDNRRQYLLLSERGQQIAVLEERRRLARELHDSVTQSLFSMSLLAQVLPDLWEIDRAEARAGLVQIRDMTRGALAEMRALLFELRPAALGERSLAHALREHASAFTQRAGVPIALDVANDVALPEAVEQAFFRIAQEALTNIARHARARQARVTLAGGPPARLLIADDGQGFQPERIAAGSFGLQSMRERAAGIGARLEVRSAVGQGAEIVVEWPKPGD
jgi:GAF domain-containing protein